MYQSVNMAHKQKHFKRIYSLTLHPKEQQQVLAYRSRNQNLPQPYCPHPQMNFPPNFKQNTESMHDHMVSIYKININGKQKSTNSAYEEKGIR